MMTKPFQKDELNGCPDRTPDRGAAGASMTAHPLLRAVVGGAAASYLLAGRGRQLHWGATGRESADPLPGDEFVAEPSLVATRAISVGATADRVWPWIAQLGQGRGGFYSYDVLENLVGCQIHSATDIIPEWQDVKVGDEVKLAPQVPLEVAAVEPGQWLVLRGGAPMGNTPPPYDFTWALVLRQHSDRTTRLLVRERYAYRRWWAPLLVEPVEIVSFVMHQKMLREIRGRAERADAATCGES
jgi:hypothetical protein